MFEERQLARFLKAMEADDESPESKVSDKSIIPEESGLTYNEAWGFMKKILEKYDYYYQK